MAQIVTGIDIGNVNLSAVSIRRQGEQVTVLAQATVSRYAANGAKKPLSIALTELARSCPFKGKVVLGSSQIAVLIRFISTIPMPPDRLERLLRLELGQHADDSGDLSADHFEVPLLAGDEIIQCCCIGQVGPMRSMLSELAAADLKPQRVHAPAVALGNTLSLVNRDDDNAFGLVVDIGAKTTRLVLRRGPAVLAAREVNLGGDAFTEALAKERNLSFEQAEEIKRTMPHLAAMSTKQQSATPSAVPTPSPESQADAGDEAQLDWLNLDSESSLPPAAEADDKATDNDFLDDLFQQPPATDHILAERDQPEITAAASPLSRDEPTIPDATDPDFLDLSVDPGDPENGVKRAKTIAWQRSDGPSNNPAPDLHDPGASTVFIGRAELGPELSRAAETLAGQLSASLTWFRSQLKLGTITLQQIEICGGGAKLIGLAGYLERRMRAPVTTWNPGATLMQSKTSIPPLALGLALSGGFGCPDLDLRPESLLYRQRWRQQVLWLWASAIALLLCALTFIVGHSLDRSYYDGEISSYEAHKKLHTAQTSELQNLRLRRDELALDVRGIAARIFAGRDLLYVIRALKQAAEVHQDLWVAEFRTESVAGEQETIANPTGRGGRTGRGTNTGRNETPKIAAHNDTSIDRGKIFVRVVIRRDSNRDAQAYERIFRDWLGGVMNWQRPDNGQSLFSDYQQTEVPSLNDQYEYEVRFDFRPTNLSMAEGEQ